MAYRCPVTNRTSLVGGSYSNRTRATQFNPCGTRRRHLNLQTKRVYIPELKKKIVATLSARGWKTLAKKGAYVTLKEAGLI